MIDISEVKSREVIIDTNVLIHYSSEGFVEESGNPLRILLDNENSLAIPPIVGFELLESDNRAEVEEKYLALLNFVPTLEMQMAYYNNAAQLSKLYRIVCNKKKIPIPDLLIGSIVSSHTSVEGSDGPLLLTCDRSDFCEPLWQTVSQVIVKSETDEMVRTIIYLLQFNARVELDYSP